MCYMVDSYTHIHETSLPKTRVIMTFSHPWKSSLWFFYHRYRRRPYKYTDCECQISTIWKNIWSESSKHFLLLKQQWPCLNFLPSVFSHQLSYHLKFLTSGDQWLPNIFSFPILLSPLSTSWMKSLDQHLYYVFFHFS